TGVDRVSHFDLRYAARRRWDALQAELSQKGILGDQRPLALVDAHRDRRLTILRRREGLLLLDRRGRVFLDQFVHDAALNLHAQRQRHHVDQQQIGATALQQLRPQQGGPPRRQLVGVGSARSFLAEDLADKLANTGLVSHPTRQDHFLDGAWL